MPGRGNYVQDFWCEQPENVVTDGCCQCTYTRRCDRGSYQGNWYGFDGSLRLPHAPGIKCTTDRECKAKCTLVLFLASLAGFDLHAAIDAERMKRAGEDTHYGKPLPREGTAVPNCIIEVRGTCVANCR